MFKIEVAIPGESLPVVSIRGQVEHMDKRWIHILQAHWCWSFYEGRTPPGLSHLSINITSWYYVEELVSNAFFFGRQHTHFISHRQSDFP